MLATSGLPVYRSLNQSAINWQAVPARLEGGPSTGGRLSLIHRFRFLRDRIFLSRRIFIFHRGKTHFSPPPRKRDPRLSPPLFFPQPSSLHRFTIDSTSFTIFNFVQDVVLNFFRSDLTIVGKKTLIAG